MCSNHYTLGVLLAAGQSHRFAKGNKLLTPIAGAPLVSHAARALAATGCDAVMAIVSDQRVATALPLDYALHFISPGLDFAFSFRSAIEMAEQRRASRVLVCLGDMPGISEGLLRQILARSGDQACVLAGRRMPPVVLTARSFGPAHDAAVGNAGARVFIAGLPTSALTPISAEIAIDIDTVADAEELNRQEGWGFCGH